MALPPSEGMKCGVDGFSPPTSWLPNMRFSKRVTRLAAVVAGTPQEEAVIALPVGHTVWHSASGLSPHAHRHRGRSAGPPSAREIHKDGPLRPFGVGRCGNAGQKFAIDTLNSLWQVVLDYLDALEITCGSDLRRWTHTTSRFATDAQKVCEAHGVQ